MMGKVKWLREMVLSTVVLFVANIAHPVSASTLADAEVRVATVGLFKNGLGYFQSTVTIPPGKTEFTIGPLASASQGSFWVAYPPEIMFKNMTAEEIEISTDVNAVTIGDILKANVGTHVRLHLSDQERGAIEGTLVYFGQASKPVRLDPYSPGQGTQTDQYYGFGLGGGGYDDGNSANDLAIVKTDNGEIATVISQIRQVVFPECEMKRSVRKTQKAVAFQVRLAQAAMKGEKLTLSYLAKGITWVPSYHLDIGGEGEARISAKAVIINGVCDLEEVEVSLITGYPSFRFAHIASPLALKKKLAAFMKTLGSNNRKGGPVYRGGGLGGGAGFTPDDISPIDYSPAEVGAVVEDMFIYPLENVDLAKGQVGYFALFTESIPYEQLYECKIPDHVDTGNAGNSLDFRHSQDVWHVLRLKNSTPAPWIGVAIQIVKDGQILGQDMMDYTSVNGNATLRIANAVDVKVELKESEQARFPEVWKYYFGLYDRVVVEGLISVTNFQTKEISMEIVKACTGEVTTSEPEARVEISAEMLSGANPQSLLTWRINLEAGEQRELGYNYTVYVGLAV